MKTTLVLLVLALMATACGATMNNCDAMGSIGGAEYDDLMGKTRNGEIAVKLSENSAAACGQTWRETDPEWVFGRPVYDATEACRKAAGCDQPHQMERGTYYYPDSFNDARRDKQGYCFICRCW